MGGNLTNFFQIFQNNLSKFDFNLRNFSPKAKKKLT